MKHLRWWGALALACVSAFPVHAQSPLTYGRFHDFVLTLPATSTLDSSDRVPIVQGGQTKRWAPFNSFLNRDASNATLPEVARNILPSPANGNCLVGDGTDWNAGSCVTLSATPLSCADLTDDAASCSIDTTNAGNISAGTLAAARGGAGTINGALKGNGSGVVSNASCADLADDAPSCATDTTNASNISSGVLASGRGGAGAITGALKGSGAGVVSQAACSDLSNAGTACTASTGTSGGAVPFLNAANTWSATQIHSQVTTDTIRATNPSSGSHTIHNDGTNTDVNAPTGNLDFKVGNAAVLRVTAAGVSMQAGTITGLPAPSGASDAATKAYVDNIAAGVMTLHPSVYAATTANLAATQSGTGVGATLTNSGAQAAFSTDGVSPPITSRVLVKNQTTAQHNGIYTLTTVGDGATNWVLTRAVDFDAAGASEVNTGAAVIIVNGTAHGSTLWVQTGAGPFTVDTTPIVWDIIDAGAGAVNGTVSSGAAPQLAYYASTGTTVSGLTTANNGVLVTSGAGVPSITSTLPAAVQANITALGPIATGSWGGTSIGLNKGGTNADLSATGGTSQVLKQVSSGAAVTVATLSCADLSNDAASCATDTTNATNISAGTLAAARGGAGTINGALAGNGAGVVSQAACAGLSDDGTACTANTGTSGATLPFLNGTNTWSGTQTFGATLGTINAQTGTTYTLLSTDCGKTIRMANASSIALSLASLSVGCSVAIIQAGAGQVTVTAAGGATFNSPSSYTKTRAQWAIIGLSVDATAHWVMSGDGV